MLDIKFNWLRVYRSQNIGPISFAYLRENYDSEEALSVIEQNPRIKIPSVEKIQQEFDEHQKNGASIISIFDEKKYPKILRHINDPPAFLSVKGNIELLHKNCFAIVGARNSSIAGRKLAANFSKELQSKYVIVSGLARGIDAEAHKNSISNTIAVLANGINIIYPEENTDLYEQILSNNGLIISEAPFNTRPTQYWFPSRNRIIAGLSSGVLVVEAGVNSGSLMTAFYATSYGRDVYAIPGSPLDSRSIGTNTLIQKGAILAHTPEDILHNTSQSTINNSFTEHNHPYSLFTSDNELELKESILDLLTYSPISIDTLANYLNKPIQSVRTEIAKLELSGKIEYTYGNTICKRVE